MSDTHEVEVNGRIVISARDAMMEHIIANVEDAENNGLEVLLTCLAACAQQEAIIDRSLRMDGVTLAELARVKSDIFMKYVSPVYTLPDELFRDD